MSLWFWWMICGFLQAREWAMICTMNKQGCDAVTLFFRCKRNTHLYCSAKQFSFFLKSKWSTLPLHLSHLTIVPARNIFSSLTFVSSTLSLEILELVSPDVKFMFHFFELLKRTGLDYSVKVLRIKFAEGISDSCFQLFNLPNLEQLELVQTVGFSQNALQYLHSIRKGQNGTKKPISIFTTNPLANG